MISIKVAFLFVNLFLKLCFAVIIPIANEIQLTQQYYINTIVVNNYKTNPICDISKGKKIALCNEIINLVGMPLNMHLNKTAFYHLTPVCEEKTLTFENFQYERPVLQNMFPCYGRNPIMRTNWNIDDNFDTLYLCGGPAGSVFVFIRIQTTESDEYHFYRLLGNAYTDYLQPMSISFKEVQKEIKLLEQITFNPNDQTIEIIYVREVVKKPSNRTYENRACELEKEIKLRLCKEILQEDLQDNIDEMLNTSMECVTNEIEFARAVNYNHLHFQQGMYPCNELETGVILSDPPIPAIYFSAGYRENSIFVYARIGEPNIFTIFGFVENLYYSDTDTPQVLNLDSSSTRNPAVENELFEDNPDSGMTANSSEIEFESGTLGHVENSLFKGL